VSTPDFGEQPRGASDGYVEPTEYLTDVLARVGDASTDAELDALLPDRWRHLGPPP
jgi:hypothetical protein